MAVKRRGLCFTRQRHNKTPRKTREERSDASRLLLELNVRRDEVWDVIRVMAMNAFSVLLTTTLNSFAIKKINKTERNASVVISKGNNLKTPCPATVKSTWPER